ncbi:hypothetical protein Mp_7g08990 [Marchantia polymorpha subsp. ruderalis]|uniref:Uncharacterized protein n=2 Tax=Marchantia polymorpha TaxID=3197 RepID=A0AAF6BXM1_MARPO|nr:hypothetical protein MARPO_0068s0052 [Marchantia polymorpha]BBN16755.1 hypothetical protein Mp_7g08990 [Marchantia polymorpha subsp. ruderalis]|eukprot:PTQ35837.1 hypothetical protein MARPO_0068s0052 [Marchantia polymorpha]
MAKFYSIISGHLSLLLRIANSPLALIQVKPVTHSTNQALNIFYPVIKSGRKVSIFVHFAQSHLQLCYIATVISTIRASVNASETGF